MTVRIIQGDCLDVLPRLAADGLRVHAVVTDPPYHLTSIVKRFGGEGAAPAKSAQTGVYARSAAGFMGQKWDGGDVAFRPETWAAVASCMRPGAHLAAFGGTRTYHRMAVAIEDAGLEIRDTLAWVFAGGFPKSHNQSGDWTGWGSALKPAFEPIILARKPLCGTTTANLAAHGCGALNIDGCRVPLAEPRPVMVRTSTVVAATAMSGASTGATSSGEMTDLGRWPANLLHDGSAEVMDAFATFGESTSSPRGRRNTAAAHNRTGSMGASAGDWTTHGHADAGSPARFFYCAKADATDRSGSKHPTVKPGALMRWLVKLIVPPRGTVLDPFAGTGSTGLAADQLGMDAVLIEQSAEYAADARRKLTTDAGLFARVAAE